MTTIALLVGISIGWLLCSMVMKRAYKTSLDRQRKLYRSHYDRAVRREVKNSKSKNP